ncbi:hypothetical protein CLU79DRAFT_516298 [Phycomyces nitens]|nr:hypothetical protein CLU79DRAFT_516298 [Phycomyces nitens]
MSGFFGSSEGTRWGGLLKQAISNVETTFDSLLEQNEAAHQQDGRRQVDDGMETETFVDPISGAVTTIQRPKKPDLEPKSPTYTSRNMPSPSRQSTDLSSRLAAVLSEKGRKTPISNSPDPSRTPRPEVATPNSPKPSVKPVEPSVEKTTDEPAEPSKETSIEKDASTETNIDPIVEPSKEIIKVAPKETESIVVQDQQKKEDNENNKDNKDNEEEQVESDDKKDESPKETSNDPITPIEKADESPQLPVAVNSVVEPNHILEQRELQLLQAMETIAKLHDQIHQSQQDTEKSNQDYQKANEEIKELKSQLETFQAGKPAGQQKSTRKLESTIEELKQQISLKEEQIQGLMHEGEKLSKNELKHTTTIKKLRSEKSENDKLVTEMQKRQDKVVLDLMDANTKISKAAETEKRLQESVKMLSDMTERQTKHINRLESEAIVAKEQHTKTQSVLDATLASLEEEREKLKTESEEVHAAALEKEVKANDRLYKELTKAKEDAEVMEAKLRKEESIYGLKYLNDESVLYP